MLRLFVSGIGRIFHISMVENLCPERCFRRYDKSSVVRKQFTSNAVIGFRSFSLRYPVVGYVKWIGGACLQSIGAVCEAGKDVWTETLHSRTSKCEPLN